MGRLKGKLAVVTGGGSGIGLAIAECFAADGAQLVLVGRRKERLDQAVAGIGGDAYGVSADVADEAQIKALFDDLPRVDLLVTCAGAAVLGPVDELPLAEARKLFEARFFGQLAACHYAVPKMPEGGAILLCSGVAGRVGLADYSAGSALCGAINAMTRALAVELAPRGIRVNALSPGFIVPTAIESNLVGEKLVEFARSMMARIPLDRPGQPTSMADAAYFLATCDYVSGQVIDVDGGWTAS
jgi:NAD(P)-dependent dehydrogenase (short-subunit alcohol dehydrogenase family)